MAKKTPMNTYTAQVKVITVVDVELGEVESFEKATEKAKQLKAVDILEYEDGVTENDSRTTVTALFSSEDWGINE